MIKFKLTRENKPNDIIRYMKKIFNFKVIIESDENNGFFAHVPSVPGCATQGETYDDTVKNIQEALELCLETAEEILEYKEQIVYPSTHSKSHFFKVLDMSVSI